MQTLPHIEVILPIFNEERNIPLLISRLDDARGSLKGRATVSYLFVNDGSSDHSREILDTLHQKRSDIRVIHLLHNFGHPEALTCGIDHFQGDLAVIMDADLQDPPSAMVPLFEAWLKGSKTVVVARGERPEKAGVFFKMFYWILRKLAPTLPPINYGTHCLVDKTVIERLKNISERNRYFPGLVGFTSGNVASIQLDRQNRAHGTSRVGTFGLINLAITAFLSFSSAPIRLVSVLGIVSSIVATMGAVVIVGIKIFTSLAIPCWASTMSLIFFSSGIQLLCLGLMGEYVARIYTEVKQRPIYMVGEIKDQPAVQQSRPVSLSNPTIEAA